MKYDNTARKTQSEENKKRIIRAASALIGERGFDNVSVSDITEAAGVSKGAFYIHFRSKEDLVESMINLTFTGVKNSSDGKTVYESVAHFLIKSVEEIEKSGIKMAQKWFSDSVTGSLFGRKKLAYDLGHIAEVIKDKCGDRAREVSEKIVSAYYGALNLWCFTGGEIDPNKIMRSYVDGELKEILI